MPAETEKRRMEMYRAGFTDREIAEEEWVVTSTIHKWRKLRGLPANHARNLPIADNRMELWQAGGTDAQIADAIGATIYCVRQWRYNHGLRRNGHGTAG